MYYDWGWKPYVSAAERRRKAARKQEQLRKKGHSVAPVTIEGRTIVKTFWGRAWCENLERYSDFANRLPHGRTYVRNGSVIDLQIGPGEIKALVSGSEIYTVTIRVTPVKKERWKSICGDCAGAIDSLVELLQGRFSKGVMERLCRQRTGLFPSPKEIQLSCSCPDWAEMCKHVAAVLYGVGARLDRQPELLFRLHELDEKELIAHAGEASPLANQRPATAKVLGDDEDLSALFGVDIAQDAVAIAKSTPGAGATRKRAKAAKAKTAGPDPAQQKAVPAKPVRPKQKTGGSRAAVKQS